MRLLDCNSEEEVLDRYVLMFNTRLSDCEIRRIDGLKIDRYLEYRDLMRIPIEFKHNNTLRQRDQQCKVLIQLLYYVKQMKQLPTAVIGADKTAAFIVMIEPLMRYLNFTNINWSLAPSNAGSDESNKELVQEMVNDSELDIYTFRPCLHPDYDDFDSFVFKLYELHKRGETGEYKETIKSDIKESDNIFYNISPRVPLKSVRLEVVKASNGKNRFKILKGSLVNKKIDRELNSSRNFDMAGNLRINEIRKDMLKKGILIECSKDKRFYVFAKDHTISHASNANMIVTGEKGGSNTDKAWINSFGMFLGEWLEIHEVDRSIETKF